MTEWKTPESSKGQGGQGVGCFVLILLALGFGAGGYEWLDQQGYISHTVETSITAEPGWLVGESKTCSTEPLSVENARFYKANVGDVTHVVSCDSGPYHQIKVTFWGRTERTDQKAKDYGVSWKCTKNSDSFTCRDLD